MAINQELAFAKDYYRIKAGGIVVLDENTPEDVKERFWKTWKAFHAKVVEMQKKGVFSSSYSVLPMEDPEENKKHYEEDVI